MESKMQAGEKGKIEISVVLPAHNEAKTLENAVRQTKSALADFSSSFEVIIAEDGSTDGTAEIASLMAAEEPLVTHLHSDSRLGKGKALSTAFKLAKGKILVFLDMDLSTDLAYLKPLIDAVKEEHYDFAIGSRTLKGSDVKRSFKRTMMSTIFNSLVRLILSSNIKDHQCGFKSFRRDSLMSFIDEIKDEHLFWDTEMLIRAQRKGYRIKEIPVKWEEKEGSGTKVRLFRDGATMFYKIIALKLKYPPL
jgi:glycosyltransferase involved in cell wall biosynthesis